MAELMASTFGGLLLGVIVYELIARRPFFDFLWLWTQEEKL